MTTGTPDARPRLRFPDGVRAAAILMVVVLHVAATVVVQLDRIPANAWWVANVLDAAMRPAVPLFVMVSGLLLLDPAVTAGGLELLRARARRLLLPFAAWVAIYLGWRAAYHGEVLSWGGAVHEILRGPVYPHLWFLYMIVGLYLTAPVLRVYVRHASPANQTYFVSLCLVATSVLPFLRRWAGIEVGVDIVPAGTFCGYFLLGHLMRTTSLARGGRRAATVALAALVAVTAGGTFWLSRLAHQLDVSLYEYHAPNVVLMSVLWFLLLRPRESHVPRLGPAVASLARASFGIYLVHPMFQELYQGAVLGFPLHGLTGHPALGIPVAAAAVAGTSWLAVVLFWRALGCASSWARRIPGDADGQRHAVST